MVRRLAGLVNYTSEKPEKESKLSSVYFKGETFKTNLTINLIAINPGR